MQRPVYRDDVASAIQQREKLWAQRRGEIESLSGALLSLYQKSLARLNVGLLGLGVFWLCAVFWLCTAASLWPEQIDSSDAYWPGGGFSFLLLLVAPAAGVLYLASQKNPRSLQRALERQYSLGGDVFRDIERLSVPVRESALSLLARCSFYSWWVFISGLFSVLSLLASWLWLCAAIEALRDFSQFYLHFLPFFLPAYLLLGWRLAAWTRRRLDGYPKGFWSGVGYALLGAFVAGLWAVLLTRLTQNHVSCFWPFLEFFVGVAAFGLGALTVAPVLLWRAAIAMQQERRLVEELRSIGEEKPSLHPRGTIVEGERLL